RCNEQSVGEFHEPTQLLNGWWAAAGCLLQILVEQRQSGEIVVHLDLEARRCTFTGGVEQEAIERAPTQTPGDCQNAESRRPALGNIVVDRLLGGGTASRHR